MAGHSIASGSATPTTVIDGEEEFLKTGVLPASLAGAPVGAAPPRSVSSESAPPPDAEPDQPADPDAPTTTEEPDASNAPPPDGTTPSPTADWEQALASVDPKELLRNRRMAGIIGSEAQRIAKEQADKAAADATRAAAEAERLAIRDADPNRYIELEKARETEDAIRAAAIKEADTPLHLLYSDLSEADQREIAGKQYPGDATESRLAYLRDLVGRHVKAGQAELRASIEAELRPKITAEVRAALTKELTPAIKAQVIGQRNGNRPAPDTTGSTGQTASRGLPTLAELSRMSNEEFARREKEILGATLGALPR